MNAKLPHTESHRIVGIRSDGSSTVLGISRNRAGCDEMLRVLQLGREYKSVHVEPVPIDDGSRENWPIVQG